MNTMFGPSAPYLGGWKKSVAYIPPTVFRFIDVEEVGGGTDFLYSSYLDSMGGPHCLEISRINPETNEAVIPVHLVTSEHYVTLWIQKTGSVTFTCTILDPMDSDGLQAPQRIFKAPGLGVDVH